MEKVNGRVMLMRVKVKMYFIKVHLIVISQHTSMVNMVQ